MFMLNRLSIDRFLILVLLLSGALWLSAGTAFGQQPPYPLNAAGVQYYIIDTVINASDGTSANGKTVRLHPVGDPNFKIAEAVIANNQYIINAFETYVIPVGTYQVSILRANLADYGAGPSNVDITGKGWDDGPTLTLSLNGGPGPIEIATDASLPNAIAGQPYSQALSAQGGSGTYLWSLEGALPAGLSGWLQLSEAGVLSGTPAAANVGGPYTFTVKAADNTTYSSGTKSFALSVQAEGVVAGAVPLTIDREGDHVKIGWSTANPPDIYYQPGDGTGQFSNQYPGNPAWTLINLVGLTLDSTPIGYSEAGKYILHKNQVGKTPEQGGIKEVYYKGVVHGTDPSQGDGATIFSQAPAVGKVDYTVSQGYNLISIPFEYTGAAAGIGNVISNYLTGGSVDNADRVYLKEQSTTWGMPNAYLDAGGVWRWSNNDAVASIDLNNADGYLIRRIQAGDEVLTLVGNVADTVENTMTFGYNAISVGLPKSYLLNTDPLGLFGLANVTAGSVATADRLYIKTSSSSWGMPNVYLAPDGNWRWSHNQALVGGADIFRFGLPFGYLYKMRNATSGAQIIWQRSL